MTTYITTTHRCHQYSYHTSNIIYRARATLQFRGWWLACNEQPLSSQPAAQLQTTEKICTMTIHHRWAYYTDRSPPFSAPTASDNSIGPLRGRAWSLVPPTRRTTSTHHPLQLSTKWFMTPFCPQYSRNTDAAPPPTSPSTNIII